MKNTGLYHYIFLLLTGLLIFGCNSAEDPDPSDLIPACDVITDSGNYPDDFFTIASSSIDADCFEMNVEYAACTDKHQFRLVWDGLVLLNPTRVKMDLMRDGLGEECEKQVAEPRSYDLTGVRQFGVNSVLVDIHYPDGTVSVTYEY